MDLSAIGRKFRKIGKDTVAEVQKMNDIRQINSKISEQKKQISAIYSQIGQKLYKLYKEAPLEGFDAEFQKIEERLATIEVYNDQIREIKGVRICPNCHTEVSLSERYCSACGQKLPEILHIQKDENGNTVIEGANAEIIDVAEQKTPDPEISGEAEETKAETEVPEEPEAAAEETEEVKAEAFKESEMTAGEAKEAEAEVAEEPETAAEETEEVKEEGPKESETTAGEAKEAKAEAEVMEEPETTAENDGEGQQP